MLTSDGPVPRSSSPQYDQFLSAFNLANLNAKQVSSAKKHNDDLDVQQSYRQMVIDGFGLVYANCSDFFQEEGHNQEWILFSRDVVGAVGTLATAVVAATSAPTGVTTGFGIATAAGFNGLDIYQRNFLFGAENIESVRTLITNALAAHSNAVLDNTASWKGFGDAAGVIMDHQGICMPSSILLLTKTAIRNGKVETNQSAGDKQFTVTVATATPPASGLSQSQPARALRAFFDQPGLTPEERRTRLLAIEAAAQAVSVNPPSISSFIRDSSPHAEAQQTLVARRMKLIP